jgi:HTH-type transcriptional regulator/antitoxin HigA
MTTIDLPPQARGGHQAHPTYLKLVRKFPLRSLRNDSDLGAAQAVLDALLRAVLDAGGRDYFDALTDLIETYEREAHPMPDAPESDVLRLLMESNNLSQSQLAEKVGIAQSTISAVLNGTRGLTRLHIVKLARFFNVSPVAFLARG